MDALVRLLDLAKMHPNLLWDTIAEATAGVFEEVGAESPYQLGLTVEDVPGYGSGRLSLLLDRTGISDDRIARLRRTYEPARLIELAAIAVAGVGLSLAGGHEIVNI